MSISTKTVAALLAIFIALLIGGWTILDGALRPGFEHLEAESHARDRARIEFNIATGANDVEARALDYAHWDDTYSYVRGGHPRYVADNFQDRWFADYDINLMGLAAQDGRILWARGIAPDVDRDFGADAVRAALANGAADATTRTGVIWVDGLAIVATVARVTNSAGTAPPRGYVVVGRLLSAAALSEQAQLKLDLVDAASAPIDFRARMAALQGARATSWVDAEHRHSLIALRGADGALVGAVMAERDRELAALGARATGVALVMFALTASLALGALWLLLRHVVIARIQRLEAHLKAQSTHSTNLVAIEADASTDEIGRLTEAYNDLAARLRDLAEREHEAVRQREAAAAANRMKSDFLANISHELHTPIDTVIGYAELIEEEAEERGLTALRDDARHVLTAARNLVDLVNEIHDLARIEAGRLSVSLASFEVKEMLHEVVAAGGALAKQRGNTLKTEVAADLGAAYSDELRLQQSLAYVLAYGNARTQQGEIRLIARRVFDAGQEALWFRLEDDGDPLPERELRQAFEPFATAASGLNQGHCGAALGLTIARKVIDILGGRIEAKSGERGAVFEITIPTIAPDQLITRDRKPSRGASQLAA